MSNVKEDYDNVMYVNQLNVEYRHNSLAKQTVKKQYFEVDGRLGYVQMGQETIRCSSGAPFTALDVANASTYLASQNHS